MKHLIIILKGTVVLASVLLSGCESALQAYDMSQKGTAAFSCTEINKAFSAYQRDRESASALAVLVPLISANTTEPASNTTSNSYYEQARTSANIALLVQGCPPLQ